MFKRRNNRTAWQAVSEFFYPRKGWARALNYMSYRVKRLPDTPHKIALGFSCGVFVCFTPMFGLHFVVAGVLAALVRGNVLASIVGTFVGNPLTFPVIAAFSYNLGLRILGYERHDSAWFWIKSQFIDAWHALSANIKGIFGGSYVSWDPFTTFAHDILVPYFVGGFGPGIIVSVLFYYFTRPVVAAYQKRRKGRLMGKLKELRAKRQSGADGRSKTR